MPAKRIRALFRCDASVEVGIGHAMRSLAFAETLRWAGWSCMFAMNREATTVAPALLRCDIELEVADSEEAIDLNGARLAVVDSYKLDADFERCIREQGAAVIAFDDLANRKHDCEVLVDPTPGRSGDEYADFVPADCRVLVGAKYAIIADRWLSHRHATRSRLRAARPVDRIIVSMGGTDPFDATRRVLAGIAASGVKAHVDVVIGAGTPHRAQLTDLAGPSLTVHVDHPDVAALAAEADLAIGAAGTSSFERAVLGLPAILIPLASNQYSVAAAFSAARAADVAPAESINDAETFGARIAALADDANRRTVMSQRAATLTDGRGRLRLLAASAGRVMSRFGRVVTLRLAECNDELWLLRLQQQESTRRFARHPAIPSAAEHAAWFAAALEDSERLLMIVDVDGKPCGMLRLDKLPGGAACFEISIAIDGGRQGEGIGRSALGLVRNLAPGADLIATVNSANQASLALFSAAGFTPDGHDRYRSRVA